MEKLALPVMWTAAEEVWPGLHLQRPGGGWWWGVLCRGRGGKAWGFPLLPGHWPLPHNHWCSHLWRHERSCGWWSGHSPQVRPMLKVQVWTFSTGEVHVVCIRSGHSAQVRSMLYASGLAILHRWGPCCTHQVWAFSTGETDVVHNRSAHSPQVRSVFYPSGLDSVHRWACAAHIGSGHFPKVNVVHTRSGHSGLNMFCRDSLQCQTPDQKVAR